MPRPQFGGPSNLQGTFQEGPIGQPPTVDESFTYNPNQGSQFTPNVGQGASTLRERTPLSVPNPMAQQSQTQNPYMGVNLSPIDRTHLTELISQWGDKPQLIGAQVARSHQDIFKRLMPEIGKMLATGDVGQSQQAIQYLRELLGMGGAPQAQAQTQQQQQPQTQSQDPRNPFQASMEDYIGPRGVAALQNYPNTTNVNRPDFQFQSQEPQNVTTGTQSLEQRLAPFSAGRRQERQAAEFPELRQQQVPKYQPQQEQMLEQQVKPLIDQIMSQLQGSGGLTDINPIKQDLLRDWKEQIVPAIGEKFAGLDTRFAQAPSAYAQTLGRSGVDIASKLARLGSEVGLKRESQRDNRLNAMLGRYMQPRFDTYIQQAMGDFPEESFGESTGRSFAEQLPGLMAGIAEAAGVPFASVAKKIFGKILGGGDESKEGDIGRQAGRKGENAHGGL